MLFTSCHMCVGFSINAHSLETECMGGLPIFVLTKMVSSVLQQVFLHCQVLVCGAADSRCAQHCQGRVRREVGTHKSQDQYTVSGGPILIQPWVWHSNTRKVERNAVKGLVAANNKTAWRRWTVSSVSSTSKTPPSKGFNSAYDSVSSNATLRVSYCCLTAADLVCESLPLCLTAQFTDVKKNDISIRNHLQRAAVHLY